MAAKNEGQGGIAPPESFVAENPDGSWLLSNAFVRVSGRIGSQYAADEIAFSPAPGAAAPDPVGRFGAMLQLVDSGTNTWIDTSCATAVSFSRDTAAGIASVTLRAVAGTLRPVAQAPSCATPAPSFAITARLSLAPGARDLLAEILSVENLGDKSIESWQPFLRTWSLEAEPEPVRMVLDRWAAPCEAEWKLPDGGSWGIASSDPSAKRFRFFVDPKGRQHPDARFFAVDPQGRAANHPIAPGETWRPATPPSARIYRKFSEAPAP